MASEEIDFKVKFVEKYFDGFLCDYDKKFVDIVLRNKKEIVLYIESKYVLSKDEEFRAARAQIILTNKKQLRILSKVAVIYKDSNDNYALELIECDDAVLFNNDINWKKEIPSSPSSDAIEHINNRLIGKIKTYKNDEIYEFAKSLAKGESEINITLKNCILVYNEWKNSISFIHTLRDEQDWINLFLVDMLNGTKYKQMVLDGLNIFNYEEQAQYAEKDLIREGTNLNNYDYTFKRNGDIDGIKYINASREKFEIYSIENTQNYYDFWRKYKRPPHQSEYMDILEHSSKLYSDAYRKAEGGEYTPSCFVRLQNEILREHLGDFENQYLFFDPCAGVGNLENDFGRDFKEFRYLSTLKQIDVDTCKLKGFDNVVRFDYLKDSSEPLFKYNGKQRTISEICKAEGKKLMVIMNPPYQNQKAFKDNLAIEFFNKVCKLEPEIIVFYYMTESFFRDEMKHYIKSGYKILSHCFSNAKTTFLLSEWSVSQVIFHKDKGEKISKDSFSAKRYELKSKNSEMLKLIKTYTYDLKRPSLLKEMDKEIKKHKMGMVLGNYSYLNSTIKIGNGGVDRGAKVTTDNLKYALLSKGLNFNTHHKYFELNDHCLKGRVKDIPQELFNDSIMFSLFYIGNLFSNKSIIVDNKEIAIRNYIMPFTHKQLGCAKGELNVLEYDESEHIGGLDNLNSEIKIKPFDFREWLKQFSFSSEAQELFSAALEIFRFYHANKAYKNKNYNDSFYDITNAIMGKNPSEFKDLESKNDIRIDRVKTTKGTKGFGKNTIREALRAVNAESQLEIFTHFFNVRDILARKINKQLLDSNLLLWERENIY